MSVFINFVFLSYQIKNPTTIFLFSCRYFDGNLDKLFSECHVINPSKKPRIRPPINTRSSSQDMPCQICYLNFPNSVSPVVYLQSLCLRAQWNLLTVPAALGHLIGQLSLTCGDDEVVVTHRALIVVKVSCVTVHCAVVFRKWSGFILAGVHAKMEPFRNLYIFRKKNILLCWQYPQSSAHIYKMMLIF